MDHRQILHRYVWTIYLGLVPLLIILDITGIIPIQYKILMWVLYGIFGWIISERLLYYDLNEEEQNINLFKYREHNILIIAIFLLLISIVGLFPKKSIIIAWSIYAASISTYYLITYFIKQ